MKLNVIVAALAIGFGATASATRQHSIRPTAHRLLGNKLEAQAIL